MPACSNKSSEASIGKILFQNGYKLAENQGLLAVGAEGLSARRSQLLKDFKDLSRKLERIRLMALAGLGE